ncbi:YtpR family tRNA-binding protein [Leuconostoc palmae]|uniref:YtpR family tRNA-binding protein n=1 Tax=Leuconostoc palmae TaxID=501487 RepID=UPI001C7DB5DE|nr:DUF4479 and tRNA-binding domain-containing protein [Leuconostoc palmae]
MIASYNQEALGDVLVIILKPNAQKQSITSTESVTRIQDTDTDIATGFNFFGIGELLNLTNQKGQITLTSEQINKLNKVLSENGFDDQLVLESNKLVIGRVVEMTVHPDSDHLHITQTEVGQGKTLQIVSGSPNMRENIFVVVAQPGTMMPSGAIIWDGALRGVDSSGMIVSGRELHLPQAPDKPGALVLPNDFGKVGEVFDFEKANNLYTDHLVDLDY